jgi:Sigma-70 region 2
LGPASCRRYEGDPTAARLIESKRQRRRFPTGPLRQPQLCHQQLFEAACPGIADSPHRARLYLLSFLVQNHWSRWAHARRCRGDLRWNGKVYCKPDETWDTTAAIGLGEALCRRLDYTLPTAFSKTRILGFFLLWLLAGLGLGPTWEDEPPPLRSRVITAQRQNIKAWRSGEAPFHHIDKPGPRETIKLLTLYRRTGDVIARNTVVAGYLDDAKGIARRYRTEDADDLEQDAAEALIEAVEKYAAEHEAAFSTFMYEVVEKRCIDSLRRLQKHKRLVSTELIAEKNEAALGLYGGGSKKSGVEFKIFRDLFENT